MATLKQKPVEVVINKKKYSLDTSNQKKADKRAAMRWFSKAVNGITTSAKMPDGLYTVNGNDYPFYGEMALYGYDPKWKDKLPYWDAFPLILVANIRGSGFSGFNLHYMPVRARKEIIKYMIHHKQKSKSQIIYARKIVPLLEQFSKTDIAFCYKNYLASHVRTKFVIVGREYWELACELPLQQFHKATDKQVWTDRQQRRNKK